jgi:monoterpene epsilon-lactone hydrolase
MPVNQPYATGETFAKRPDAEFYFTKAQAAQLVRAYLGNADPKDPLASSLYANPRSRRRRRSVARRSRLYVERGVAAGVDAKLDICMGMPHSFVTNIGGFSAASQALKESGAFLTERLGGACR